MTARATACCRRERVRAAWAHTRYPRRHAAIAASYSVGQTTADNADTEDGEFNTRRGSAMPATAVEPTNPVSRPASTGAMGKPSPADMATASAAFHIVLRRAAGANITLASDAVFRAVVGWPLRKLPPGHPAAAADPASTASLLEAIMHLIRASTRAALEEAVRRYLVPPRRSLEALRAIPDMQWQVAKELMLAKRLYDAQIDDAVLKQLADQRTAPSRDEFAAAFGLPQLRAQHTRWRCLPLQQNLTGRVLLPRLRASQGRLDCLSLEEALHAARPELHDGWCSVFAWFVQNGVDHFAEAHTCGGIDALAAYLQRRRAELSAGARGGGGAAGGGPPIVEIGAGGGRLAYLLNATGRLVPPLIATDPTPQPSAFPVQAMNDAAALRTHRPAIVLCAWMSVGEDWTERWRRARVDEYVLIGHLGERRSQAYSLSPCFDHAPYERVQLDAVSSELLAIEDAALPEVDPGYGRLCAVAFRRPRN